MSAVLEIAWGIVSIVAAFCATCLILVGTLWITCKVYESCLLDREGREKDCETCMEEPARKRIEFGVVRNHNVPTSAKTEALLEEEKKSATEDGGEQ